LISLYVAPLAYKPSLPALLLLGPVNPASDVPALPFPTSSRAAG